MKSFSKIFIIFFIIFTLMSCSINKEDIPKAKQSSMSFPINLISNNSTDLSSDFFDGRFYSFYPGSVYIDNSNVYLSLVNGLYSIDLKEKTNPKINYKIIKDDFEYLNYNSPNLITADSYKNIYVENLNIREEEITNNKGKKESILKKINHRIFKFDYEGNFLYSIGPNGKNDVNHFSINESIELLNVDEFDNLSIIIKKYFLDNDLQDNEFKRSNIDFYKYRFLKIDRYGEILYTLDFSSINEINLTKPNQIRVIQDIKVNAKGDKIIISTKDYMKKDVDDTDYYIEITNLRLYIYDLGHNELLEKHIKLENDQFYLFGISKENKIFLCRPDDVYGLRFIVLNTEGNIIENKKIVINNIRQNRYNFIFNKNGYISSIFLEDDMVKIIQYR